MLGARLLLTAAVVCSAVCVHLAGATEPLVVPFFELEELKVSDAIAVGRFASLIDQRSLYARRLTDGATLIRIDDVGRAPFDIDDNRLVYAHALSGRVISVDVTTNLGEELWRSPPRSHVLAVHVFARSVLLIVEDDEGMHALWSETSERWQAVDVPGHLRVAALVRNRIVAIDRSVPGRLVTATLSGGGSEWVTLYESPSSRRIDAVRPLRDGATVTFLERDLSGAASAIVRLPLDAAGRPDTVAVPDTFPDATRVVAWSSDYLAWPERRDSRLFLKAVALITPASPPSTVPPPGTIRRHQIDVSAERSVAWLERQLSKPVVSRHGRPARLIDSYEDAQRAGWIYDAALAAITFAAVREPATASELLAGLEHLQRDDGSWMASFDPDTALPRGSDRYVGAMAWVVMAANFYEWETGDGRFAAMARRGLSYLEGHRITDAGSDLRGAFRMGPSRPGVISTEHNVDCYSAFLWRGRLERNQRDLAIAEDVRAFILRELWVEPDGAASSDGFFRVGAAASTLFLDAQTWTALAFSESLPDPRLEQALRSAERLLRVDTGRLGPVQHIIGLDESEISGREKVWGEGSEGMVAALFAVGDSPRARQYHAETARYQSVSGGIPYATENRSGWTTAPAVAATAWYVLNSTVPSRNPFNPGLR